MSLAYIDPGNLEAEVQLGAYTGARLIWVLWWSTVVGAMLQELAARIGMVSGNDLAHAVRARYPRWLTYTVYVNLELAIMGADLQDLLGTAHALRLLTGLPLYLGAIVSSALSMLLLYVYESQRRYMEVGIGITILIVCTCFFVNMWHAQPKVGDIVEGMVVPGMQWWAALPALGCVGAVIMPHNLFLHSNVVLSRRGEQGSNAEPSRLQLRLALYYTRIETCASLFVTYACNVAVVAMFAPLFYDPKCIGDTAETLRACVSRGLFGDKNISIAADGEVAEACILPATGGEGICSELELGDAGLALGAVLGRSAMLMWGVGLFVAGQASVLATTYAGQALMDGCLRVRLPAMTRVTLSRLISIGPAVAVAIWTEASVEMAEKMQLMQWINAFQALQLPFAMLPTLHFVADRKTLGSFRASGCWLALCWGVALTLILANVILVTTFVLEWDDEAGRYGALVVVVAVLYATLYFAACFTLAQYEIQAVFGALRSAAGRLRGRLTGSGESGGPTPPPDPLLVKP